MKKKTIALVLACILCVGIGIGGTLAWLTATSGAVTNTFTAAKLGEVTITETDTTTGEATATGQNYLLTPGVDIPKDPKLSFTRTDSKGVAAFVFVKVTAANWTPDSTHMAFTISDDNGNKQLEWGIASGWTYLQTDNDGSHVYYQRVAENAALENVYIMKDNKISVSGDYITTANINDLAGKMGITFTPSAIQQEKSSSATFGADEAWAKLNPTTPTT